MSKLGVAHRRDLFWQVHLLRQDHLALLKRTLHVHILDLVAEINGLLDQSNEAPFDFQSDGSTLIDPLEQGTAGLNGEGLATVRQKAVSLSISVAVKLQS